MPEKLPCDVHDEKLERLEKDINNIGGKYDMIIFGKTGNNGLVGTVAKIESKIALNHLFMSGISIMCIGILGLLIKLVFFGPVK